MQALFSLRPSILVAAALSCVAVFCAAGAVEADVLITEIMYDPPEDKDCEYVEIHNSGAALVDLSGWRFTEGIQFTFPPGTQVPGGGHLVACRSTARFLRAYPSVDPSILVGDYDGSLANEGERVTLESPDGQLREEVLYGSGDPWDFLAHGFGSSLERSCLLGDPNLASTWRASPVPAEIGAPGGSPGGPGVESCAPLPSKPNVRVSEVMYHPVLEESIEDDHEFVEIFNAGAEPVPLEGWRLVGGIRYTFPAGAALDAGQY